MNKVKFSSLNKAVFEQIDLPDNAVIADLGCRDAGSLLGFQQAFPNKIKTAVGVDINDKGFKNIKYKKPIKLKVMDCSKKLEFADKIAELLICKPRNLHFPRHHKQLLKTPVHFIFEFLSEVILNYKAQSPQRKITRIVCPFAGDITVTVTAGNLNELPHRPCIRFPDELKKNIIIDEIIVFIRVKNFIRISRNIKIILPFYYKLFGESIKQRKPRKMTVLRNGYYLIREFYNVTEIRVVRYNCITSL